MWPLLLLACDQPPLTLPPTPGPPSVAVLSHGSLVLDRAARAVVRTDAPVGTTVQLWMSERTTTACVPGAPGACLGLVSPQLVGEGEVGADGLARVAGVNPARRAGAWYAQAAVLAAPTLVTSTLSQWAGPHYTDDDRDGLPAGIESDAWLSPRDADSDGGGVYDFQELIVDGTDGANPSDDLPGERACANAADDDGDGLADCGDPDCGCGPEQCADGADNDRDGLADCEDADCLEAPGCVELACSNGRDDDGDGTTDCADEDCWSATCHDATLAWVVGGQSRQSSGLSYHYGPSWLYQQGSAVVGRVRVVDGTQVETCTWRVAKASWRKTWPATFFGVPVRPGSEVYGRLGFVVDPACEVGEDILPPMDRIAWTAWYGAWRMSTGGYGLYYASAGPILNGQPWGACPAGNAPVMAFEDHDGDGYGQDGVDYAGQPGGRVWLCDPPGPLHVLQGGDCDDADPTANPSTVRFAPGHNCLSARPWDQDGDGVDAAVDGDDHDGGVR